MTTDLLRDQLISEADTRAANAFVPDTRAKYRAYQIYFVQFLLLTRWLSQAISNPELAASTILPAYVAWLARTCKAGVIRTYLNGVRFFYLSRGLINPSVDNFWIKNILRQVRKENPDGTNRKMGITIAILRSLARNTDIQSPLQVAFMTAALFAFFAFLRKSNVSLKRDDPLTSTVLRPPRRCDIRIDTLNQQIWLRLRFTKTIHFRERELEIPIPIIPDDLLNPLMWYTRHLLLSPSADPNLTAFAYLNATTNHMCPLLHSYFVARTKQIAAMSGFDPKMFSGHSYRKGGATFAFECGAPGELIKVMGDWTSDAYLLYLNFSAAVRSSLSTLLASGTRARK